MPPNSDSERARGILTPGDREFLASDRTDYKDTTIRQKWYRIGKRVRNAIKDFSLLLEHLPQDRLGQMFYPDDREEQAELNRAMRDALALFFIQQYEAPKGAGSYDDEEINERLFVPQTRQNRFVEQSLLRMLERRGESLRKYDDFEYDTSQLNLEDLWQRFLSGENLSLNEFETLQEASSQDIRGMVSVLHTAALSGSERTEDDNGEVLIDQEQRLVWNQSTDEDEGSTDPNPDPD